MVCLSEPLILISYCLRFVRVKKIFEAQQIYFEEKIKPTEIINKYSERRLLLITIFSISALTITYIIIAIIPWFVAQSTNGYGVLPTFSLGYKTLD